MDVTFNNISQATLTPTPETTSTPAPETTPVSEQTTTPDINGEEIAQAIMEVQKTNESILEAQHIEISLFMTVLFFFIFTWAEKKIKHAVKSFTGRGLDE